MSPGAFTPLVYKMRHIKQKHKNAYHEAQVCRPCPHVPNAKYRILQAKYSHNPNDPTFKEAAMVILFNPSYFFSIECSPSFRIVQRRITKHWYVSPYSCDYYSPNLSCILQKVAPKGYKPSKVMLPPPAAPGCHLSPGS